MLSRYLVFAGCLWASLSCATAAVRVDPTDTGPSKDFESLPPLSLADSGLRTVSRSLGKGFSPADDIRILPYMELATGTLASPASAVTQGAGTNLTERFLIGGIVRYAIAPRWSVSVDLAVGEPLRAETLDRTKLTSAAEDDETPFLWRTGAKLGYAVNRNFNFVTAVEVNQYGAKSQVSPTAQTGGDTQQASFTLGFAYRF